jgi:hypothetical protein
MIANPEVLDFGKIGLLPRPQSNAAFRMDSLLESLTT